MAGEKEAKTRNYRSKDERKAEIDKKIKYHKDCIETLQRKKAAIDSNRRGGTRQKGLTRLINEARLPGEELMKIMIEAQNDEEKVKAKLIEIIEEKAKAKAEDEEG